MTTQTGKRSAMRMDSGLVRKKVLRVIGRIILYAVLTAGAFVFSLPFLWMVSASVKPKYMIYDIPVKWIPPQGRVELDAVHHLLAGAELYTFLPEHDVSDDHQYDRRHIVLFAGGFCLCAHPLLGPRLLFLILL